MAWYVVRTKPRMEILAATLLEDSLNLKTYYPEVSVRRRGKVRSGAFFPSYIFVKVDLRSTALSAIDYTPGVLHLVRFQGEPSTVSDEIVQHVRSRVDGINAAGGLPSHQFHTGDPVRITLGPLQGLEGVFDGSLTSAERVTVLLRFLGGERRVIVDIDALEPDRNPRSRFAEKRPRRSRGVGRSLAGSSSPAAPPWEEI